MAGMYKIEAANKEEFVKKVNQARRQGGWYAFAGIVEGKNVILKGHGTWLQVYKVDGLRYAGLVDRNVGQFTEDLMEPFVRGAQDEDNARDNGEVLPRNESIL